MQELRRRLADAPLDLPDTTPGVNALLRLGHAARQLVSECDGFLAREAIVASLTADERREMLRGMVLTRAVDNRLKALLPGQRGALRRASLPGQGLPLAGPGGDLRAPPCACGAVRLSRAEDGTWRGRRGRARSSATWARRWPCGRSRRRCAWCSSAQMGKAGPPMDGRDLHVGDFELGRAARRRAAGHLGADHRRPRHGVRARGLRPRWRSSFIGEGGSSLGEWHEAINLCAARRLPAIFCVQNNQTALSTPVSEQSRGARVRRQGGGLRHPRPHHRRHRSRGDRGRLRLGRRAGARRATGPRSSSSWPCACAATRTTTTCSTWAATPSRRGSTRRSPSRATPTASALRASGPARDPHRHLRRAACAAEGVIAEGDLGRDAAGGGGAGGGARRAPSSTRRGPTPPPVGAGVLAGEAPRAPRGAAGAPRRGAARRAALPRARARPRLRRQGPHLPGGGDARRGRRAARRPARVRVRRGRGREIRQRLPAAAPAAGRVRRPHPQLAARRGRRARRLRGRGAGGPAAHRRDPVQRLRGHRIQPARQQRGQDPLPLGRLGAHGGAHALGRPAPRRPLPQPEHGALVLPHARAEDRRPVDARTTRAR